MEAIHSIYHPIKGASLFGNWTRTTKGGQKMRVGYKSSTLKNETLRSLETSRRFAISIWCHVDKFKINKQKLHNKRNPRCKCRQACRRYWISPSFSKIRYYLDELVHSNLRKFPLVSFLHHVQQAKVQRKDAISYAKVYDKRKANAIKEDGEWEV